MTTVYGLDVLVLFSVTDIFYVRIFFTSLDIAHNARLEFAVYSTMHKISFH